MKATNVAIPGWNALGLLPPIDPELPASPCRSPYPVSLKDVVMRFSTSPERRAVLKGFLDYRRELHRIGIVDGIQWIDGSFLEDVEMIENRSPRDIDVVSFEYTTWLKHFRGGCSALRSSCFQATIQCRCVFC